MCVCVFVFLFACVRIYQCPLSPSPHQARFKRFMTMMDSMTDEELDSESTKLMTDSRIKRVARGSGHSIGEVKELIEVFFISLSLLVCHDL